MSARPKRGADFFGVPSDEKETSSLRKTLQRERGVRRRLQDGAYATVEQYPGVALGRPSTNGEGQ